MIVELYIDFKKFDKAISYCNLMIKNNIEKIFFYQKNNFKNKYWRLG